MRVLCISDLHAPFHHPDATDFLADLNRQYKPDRVVCLGDEIDAYAFSRFPKDPDGLSPTAELQAAVAALRPLYKLFPKVCVCLSNHAIRPYKRLMEAGIPRKFLRTLKYVLQAPGDWRWKSSWNFYGVLYVHGEGFSGRNGAITAAERFRRSTVIGHLHAFAGVQWSAGIHDRIFGMNAGCLIDPGAVAFQYAAYLANRPTLGTGVVLDGIPHFIPLGGK